MTSKWRHSTGGLLAAMFGAWGRSASQSTASNASAVLIGRNKSSKYLICLWFRHWDEMRWDAICTLLKTDADSVKVCRRQVKCRPYMMQRARVVSVCVVHAWIDDWLIDWLDDWMIVGVTLTTWRHASVWRVWLRRSSTYTPSVSSTATSSRRTSCSTTEDTSNWSELGRTRH